MNGAPTEFIIMREDRDGSGRVLWAGYVAETASNGEYTQDVTKDVTKARRFPSRTEAERARCSGEVVRPLRGVKA